VDAAAGPLALAYHRLDRGRPDRALDALEKVSAPELESYEFWNLRAHALFELGRRDEGT
jgi:Flp pilus assembly protein TadD